MRKRPRQMSAAKINMKEFKEEGPLVMQAAFRGDVKHQLDNDKSTSLKNLKFDPAQNSLVWIGTEIEKVEGQSQRTIVKTREGTLDSSFKKARERSAYKELSLMKTQMSTEETGNKTAKPEKLAKQAKLRRLRSNSGDRKKSSTKKQ
ncbi:hypothetical protein OESDEN_07336 [Oesophagostomum dentatum]|uniref:Uncharacterized protein n=1 Tax=Oesophagostomum dentatum TaxID=61180 RepID=A0A0B1TBP8_OESDE|nr:hypothetical protein OESDEN_07336 [Oesophagostomum dentatum]